MRYHYTKPIAYIITGGHDYYCDHPLYFCCTLYRNGYNGLAIIQQRFDTVSKKTWWGPIDEWLISDIFYNAKFKEYFDKNAGPLINGLYPTRSIRQVMWALKMKPLNKEKWETVFDRKDI